MKSSQPALGNACKLLLNQRFDVLRARTTKEEEENAITMGAWCRSREAMYLSSENNRNHRTIHTPGACVKRADLEH